MDYYNNVRALSLVEPVYRSSLKDSLVYPNLLEIESRYSGYRWEMEMGTCTWVPNLELKEIPDTYNLKTYRATEQDGYIWIWTGDDVPQSLPDPLPDVYDMCWFQKTLYVDCEPELMLENEMDLHSSVIRVSRPYYKFEQRFHSDQRRCLCQITPMKKGFEIAVVPLVNQYISRLRSLFGLKRERKLKREDMTLPELFDEEINSTLSVPRYRDTKTSTFFYPDRVIHQFRCRTAKLSGFFDRVFVAQFIPLIDKATNKVTTRAEFMWTQPWPKYLFQRPHLWVLPEFYTPKAFSKEKAHLEEINRVRSFAEFEDEDVLLKADPYHPRSLLKNYLRGESPLTSIKFTTLQVGRATGDLWQPTVTEEILETLKMRANYK